MVKYATAVFLGIVCSLVFADDCFAQYGGFGSRLRSRSRASSAYPPAVQQVKQVQAVRQVEVQAAVAQPVVREVQVPITRFETRERTVQVQVPVTTFETREKVVQERVPITTLETRQVVEQQQKAVMLQEKSCPQVQAVKQRSVQRSRLFQRSRYN